MNKEGFLEALKDHYSEELKSAYLSVIHQDEIDYDHLNQKLIRLMNSAQLEGLPHADFKELIMTVLPHAIPEKIEIFNDPFTKKSHSRSKDKFKYKKVA